MPKRITGWEVDGQIYQDKSDAELAETRFLLEKHLEDLRHCDTTSERRQALEEAGWPVVNLLSTILRRTGGKRKA